MTYPHVLPLNNVTAWGFAVLDKSETMGEVLREQRLDHKDSIKQLRVATSTGVSQSRLSKIENGHEDFKEVLNPFERIEVLRAYLFSESDIIRLNELYDLELGMFFRQALPVRAEGPKVPWLGEVSAGNGQSGDGDRMVTVPDFISDRYDLTEVFAMTVSGTSMVCERVRDTIPEGSLAFFHRSLVPDPGEVVCVYLQDQDIEVIKIWMPQKGYTLLESFNPLMRQKKYITVDEACPGILKGVYLTHVPLGPRLR